MPYRIEVEVSDPNRKQKERHWTRRKKIVKVKDAVDHKHAEKQAREFALARRYRVHNTDPVQQRESTMRFKQFIQLSEEEKRKPVWGGFTQKEIDAHSKAAGHAMDHYRKNQDKAMAHVRSLAADLIRKKKEAQQRKYDEGFVSAAQRKAVWASKADGGKGHPDYKKKKKIKEATYQGKKVPLNKPMAGDVKKSKVYVDPDGDGKAQKVNFGDKKLSIKKNIAARKKSYCARSAGIGKTTDKTSANYWSRKAWDC